MKATFPDGTVFEGTPDAEEMIRWIESFSPDSVFPRRFR